MFIKLNVILKLLSFGSWQILHIDLMKGAGGLGFTLSGGADTVGGCFVRDIVGGPAKEDGRLQPGDQILAVSIKLVITSLSLTIQMKSLQ